MAACITDLVTAPDIGMADMVRRVTMASGTRAPLAKGGGIPAPLRSVVLRSVR
jgi:hypothetical protein